MEDSAPLLKDIKAAGLIGFLASLPLILALSLFIGIKLCIQSIISYLFKPTNAIKTTIDESELDKSFADFTHASLISAGGVKLHALTIGTRAKSKKPCMLFLHGFPECSYSWRHQMRHFAEAYDVMAVDLRGYGKSEKPLGVSNYTLDILVADVVAVIRSLAEPPAQVVLVGHDWGGIISWLVASMHPELISHLIVLAAPHIGVAGLPSNQSLQQLAKSWYILFFQCPSLPEWLLTRDGCSFLDGAFFKVPMGLQNPSHVSPIDLEILKRSFNEPGAATATLNTYRALFANSTYRPSEAIWKAMRRRIRTPTLLLWAENDGALGLGLIKDLDQVVVDLEVKVLKNCSHWIQQDQPDMTNILIANFLARKI